MGVPYIQYSAFNRFFQNASNMHISNICTIDLQNFHQIAHEIRIINYSSLYVKITKFYPPVLMVDISSYQNAPNLAIHVNLGHYKKHAQWKFNQLDHLKTDLIQFTMQW